MNRFFAALGFMIPCGAPFGIPVFVHVSFPLGFVYVFLRSVNRADDALGPELALTLHLVGMGLVLLHEFGHALVARWLGCRTHEITLTAIGGYALIDLPTGRAGSAVRLAVACGGPAVNLCFFIGAAVAVGWSDPASSWQWLDRGSLSGWEEWAALFLLANAVILAFNLLPILPLDGGQILRNFLALFLGWRLARLSALLSTVLTASCAIGWAVAHDRWTIAAFVAAMALMGIVLLFWEAGEEDAASSRWRPCAVSTILPEEGG